MLRINNVRVHLQKRNDRKIVSQYLNVREKEIQDVQIHKLSIDARRNQIVWIISYDFSVINEDEFIKKHPQVQKVVPYQYTITPTSKKRVSVIGSGPAGLFCAYVLALAGNEVDVFERGKKVEERIKDVDLLLKDGILNEESNISFGEGGAGTFSDGKLTTGVKNKRISFILETFVRYGAPNDILYEAKPHIGTDYLRKVIIAMRKDMEKMGVTFHFESCFVDFTKEGSAYDISIKKAGELIHHSCDELVLAIGHSARDTYELLYQKGMKMEQKAFAVGVRIEQLQKDINKIQYKKWAKSPFLKAAPYKLAVQTTKKRGVYTFCMCPGGFVVPSQHEQGSICVNGMSYYDRGGENANSAILVTIQTDDFGSDHPLAGIFFQRQLEQRAYQLTGGKGAPLQRVDDYFNNVVTSELGEVKPTIPHYGFANLNELFPPFINEALKEGLEKMNEKMPGFYHPSSLLCGVEARSSAPVRLIRENYQSSFEHIYPIGEGAGYAGGIVSAALDGIMCAEKIVEGDCYES